MRDGTLRREDGRTLHFYDQVVGPALAGGPAVAAAGDGHISVLDAAPDALQWLANSLPG